MAKISLVMVCGLPASGKTTLCRELLSSACDASLALPFVVLKRECEEHSNIVKSCTDSSSFVEGKDPLCYIHVSYDDLIPRNEQEKYAFVARASDCDALSRVARESQWKKARQCVVKKVEQLILALKTETLRVSDKTAKIQEIFGCSLSVASVNSNSYVIVVDDNFYYKSMRQEYYSLCEKHKVGFCTIFMQSSVVEAVERNLSRSETEIVPSEVIEQMASKFDFDFSELENQHSFHISLEFSVNSTNCLETKSFLESVFCRSLETPVDNSAKLLNRDLREKEAAESREICSRNYLHQADNLLKKLVSDAVKSFRTGTFQCSTNVDVKVFARTANDVRVLLREKLKLGMLVIPSCDEQAQSSEFLQKNMTELFASELIERLQQM